MSPNASIKKIPVEQLRPGMYIHDLNCSWLDHPFATGSFAVHDQKRIVEIRELGIHDVYIDISRGADVASGISEEEARQEIDERMADIASEADKKIPPASLDNEVTRARRLHSDANRIVRNMVQDVRLGKQIEMEQVHPLVENMVDSIFRNQDALLPLARLKDHDNYTFQHSVSVCALLVSFGRSLGLERSILKELGVGGLLHDVGKAKVPDAILNKPAKLTDAEFTRMKSHVVQSTLILQSTPGISRIALDVAGQHHERFDGSGYPNQLRGDAITLYGRMGAIVDVYDAITSDRVYHKGMPPTAALGRLLEWSSYHFDPALVKAFVKNLGIYPTGSLVRMESGRLGVVLEQNSENMMKPRVNVIYHAEYQRYLQPEIVDLARQGCQERITGHEDYATWGIDPKRWIN
jgi:HD-GYP domain-containing protein (c-di-GMP phosphodiesterase class II)